MRSGGRPKSHRASITSRPLFIMVAESMVILGPMFQVGWASASSRVIREKVSRGRFLKGPPEAVRRSLFTSSLPRPSRHWCRAQCSESMGRRRAPLSRARASMSSPAMTRVSLLARATSLPASRAR